MIWIDVRLDRADLWKLVLGQMVGWRLSRIDMSPPASGPEVELTFGPFDEPVDTARFLRQTLEARGIVILTSRTRGELDQ